MECALTKKEDIYVITPEVESLDIRNSNEFKEKVLEIIKSEKNRHVIFDLQRVQFIDSSGLGVFLSVLRNLHNQGGDLKLAAMNKPIRTMFELISMHKVFEIYNSTDEALHSYK